MNSYCIIEEEQGEQTEFAIVDMESGEVVNMFYSQKAAIAYLDAINSLSYTIPTDSKMSWLDSLIH